MPLQGAAACASVLKVSAFCREVKSKSFCLLVIMPQRDAEITLASSPVPFSTGRAVEELVLSSSICYYHYCILTETAFSDEAAWRNKVCARKSNSPPENLMSGLKILPSMQRAKFGNLKPRV